MSTGGEVGDADISKTGLGASRNGGRVFSYSSRQAIDVVVSLFVKGAEEIL